MKATGLALIFIATCILAFSAFVAIDTNNPVPDQSQRTSSFSQQSLVIPIVTAGVMGAAGLLLFLYGGRGYSVNRRPDIQPVESREITNSVHTIEGR